MKIHIGTLAVSISLAWTMNTRGAEQTPLFGINFSAYKNGQDPTAGTLVLNATQIDSRLDQANKYATVVRTFSTTHGMEPFGALAHKHGLKTALCAWIGPHSQDASNNAEISSLIAAANSGQADLLIVGDGVLSRGDLTSSELINLIWQVRGAVSDGIPVTTSDSYNVLLDNQDVLSACTAIVANVYPYWAGVRIDGAVATLDDAYLALEAADGTKSIYIETGWPSDGNTVGDAVPSTQNEAYYLAGANSWARGRSVGILWNELYDQNWKVAHEGLQGGRWGIKSATGGLKPGLASVFQGYSLPYTVYMRRVPDTAPNSSALSIRSMSITRSSGTNGKDTVSITGALTPPIFDMTGSTISVSVGSVRWDFAPLRKNRTASVNGGNWRGQEGQILLTPGQKSWKFGVHISCMGGNPDWPSFSLINADFRSPGIPIFLPVTVTADSVSSIRTTSGFYISKRGGRGIFKGSAP